MSIAEGRQEETMEIRIYFLYDKTTDRNFPCCGLNVRIVVASEY